MDAVVWFDRIGDDDVATVGGKAVNLGSMSRAGLPVPEGFCVGTAAYREVVGSSLDDLIAELPGRDSAEQAELAAQARTRVLALALPAGLTEEIARHYAALGSRVPVAVRSSATAEDLADASFAGQQDSFLSVLGETAVLEAVLRCWASLWTDRAVAYRQTHEVDQTSVSLAVVVQRMVDAAVAGVMFTADPITGSRRRTVIDASPGLGEAVVSGAVNPDHFVADGVTGAVIERRPGDKTVVIRPRPGGGTDRLVGPANTEPCLSDAQVSELVALGRRVGAHYGSPQDTEWAIDEAGALWLTQARPITTLHPLPAGEHEGDRLLFCVTLAQGLTRPITPMGLAVFRLAGASIAGLAGRPVADPRRGPDALHTIGGRLYADVTPVLRHRVGRRLMRRALTAMEARSAVALDAVTADPRFALRPGLSGIGPVLGLVLVRFKVPLRMLQALVAPGTAAAAMTRFEHRIRHLFVLPADATPEQRLALIETRMLEGAFAIMPRAFGFAGAGLLALALARRLLGDRARPDELQTVLRGLPHNVTTEMDLELWRVTELIRADPASSRRFTTESIAALVADHRRGALPPVAARALTGFLHRYGHRAVAEIDLGMPRWSDQPDHLVGVIANYLRLDDPALDPAVQFERGAAEAEAMRRTLVDRLDHRVAAHVVDTALGRARRLIGFRESPKFLLIVLLGQIRDQLTTIGGALVDRGAITEAADVFFLEITEVEAGLRGERLTTVVNERRAAYAAELRRRRIPRLLLSDGTELEALAGPVVRPDGALAGSPASPGSVRGVARVVLDPVGAHLEPGEILVAPSTDPGWTPLFLTAGGLVMEMGGPNSHGAVVAREYGIPAVVGVPDATQLIRTGQRIRLDGAAGLVQIEPD